MNHLTVDQILDFVSLTEYDDGAIRLSAAVNGHIRKCKRCLKRTRAAQMIYDEFSKLYVNGDFKQYVAEAVAKRKKKIDKTVEPTDTADKLDGFR